MCALLQFYQLLRAQNSLLPLHILAAGKDLTVKCYGDKVQRTL